jgi:hypothetical protein
MPSSRDSSVWKSLAVAFGDGLVFAAGMKLSQRAARPAPAAAPPPAAAPAPFDRKVLEAVVHAVEERLEEHAQHVERRIAELEARIAQELKSLNKQDDIVVSAVTALREQLAVAEPSRDLLMAIGQTCLDAAGRTAPASESKPRSTIKACPIR